MLQYGRKSATREYWLYSGSICELSSPSQPLFLFLTRSVKKSIAQRMMGMHGLMGSVVPTSLSSAFLQLKNYTFLPQKAHFLKPPPVYDIIILLSSKYCKMDDNITSLIGMQDIQ